MLRLPVLIPFVLLGTAAVAWWQMSTPSGDAADRSAQIDSTPAKSDAKPQPAVVASDAILPYERWEIVKLDGQRIGHSHLSWRAIKKEGRDIVQSKFEMRLRFPRFGDETNMSVFRETEEELDGRLLSFRFRMENPPAQGQSLHGVVQGNELQLQHQTAGKTVVRSQDWEPGTLSPAWLEQRALLQNPLAPGEKRELRVYRPETGQVTTVSIVADAAAVPLSPQVPADGGKVRQVSATIRHEDNPGSPIMVRSDSAGTILETRQDFLGKAMTTVLTTKAEALRQTPLATIDISQATIIKTAAIPKAHRASRVVYRATLPGESPLKVLPTTPYQSLKADGKFAAMLTVHATPVPPNPREPAPPAACLAASQLIQKDDPLIESLSQHAAGAETDPGRIAGLLESFVQSHVQEKNFSSALASATEVARSQEGDCTEHAVLLAAMLRNRGIPARIVAGLVYVHSQGGFGGHMWTEAYIDGHWVPLDATLGLGGTAGGHIRLSTADFADGGATPATAFRPLLRVLGKLKLDVISVE